MNKKLIFLTLFILQGCTFYPIYNEVSLNNPPYLTGKVTFVYITTGERSGWGAIETSIEQLINNKYQSVYTANGAGDQVASLILDVGAQSLRVNRADNKLEVKIDVKPNSDNVMVIYHESDGYTVTSRILGPFSVLSSTIEDFKQLSYAPNFGVRCYGLELLARVNNDDSRLIIEDVANHDADRRVKSHAKLLLEKLEKINKSK